MTALNGRIYFHTASVSVRAFARPHICFAEARVSCTITNRVELGYKDIS